MAQIQGSGAGNWANTAIVDSEGRLYVLSFISGTIVAEVSGTQTVIGSVVVDSMNAWHGTGSVYTINTTSGLQTIAGSVAITSQSVWSDVGSVYLTNPVIELSGTNIVSGSVYVTNNILQTYTSGINIVLGSVTVASSSVWNGIGSVYNVNNAVANNNFIIRKDSGSPGVWYQFPNKTSSVLIDNIGSSPVYISLSGVVNPAGSTSIYLNSENYISLDLELGSVNIQGSGITTPLVQVIGIW